VNGSPDQDTRPILGCVTGKRPQADRLLVAQLTGEARHRARWRALSSDEEAAAVAALRELAGGRADLLAEVAGILEGASATFRRIVCVRRHRGPRLLSLRPLPCASRAEDRPCRGGAVECHRHSLPDLISKPTRLSAQCYSPAAGQIQTPLLPVARRVLSGLNATAPAMRWLSSSSRRPLAASQTPAPKPSRRRPAGCRWKDLGSAVSLPR
jgi:hypothetical protein